MLSINALGNGQGEYYLQLAREDYYLNGAEPPGYWLGSGAESLGMKGVIDHDQYRRLYEGFDANGRPLVQNAGNSERQPGWDLTFTVPKEVSVVWAMSSADRREIIERAHAAAVAAGIQYLEDEFAFSRRGKGGQTVEPCGFVAAAFEHGTSRNQDCNLHTHVTLLNIGVRADGTTGTILSKPLYESKLAAGALYRAELARQLQRDLGLKCEAVKSWFKLSDVPTEVTEEFSTRREQIEAELARTGNSGAKASESAALATRTAKQARSRNELFDEWHERGTAVGFGPEQAERIAGVVKPCQNPERRLKKLLPEIVDKLTDSRSHFTERDAVRAMAEAVQAEGISAEAIRSNVRDYLAQSPDMVRLGVRANLPRFTTKDLFEIEAKMLEKMSRHAESRHHAPSEESIHKAIAARPFLTQEQKAALAHLTQSGGRVCIVSGMAGTGKTTLLDAAREVWEANGDKVLGAALAGKAAQGLQEGAQIPSATIHSRLYSLDSGYLTLTPKSVVVVDEAGMVGTKLLARLADHVLDANATLVLVGDHRQLQSIEAGGAMKSLGERLGQAELKNITRQKDEWARDAIHKVVQGNAASALKSYADRGLVTVADDRRAAMSELVQTWRAGGVQAPNQHLIFAGTNVEAAELNRLCQSERRATGHVTGDALVVEKDAFQSGDRVLFTRNSKTVGVKNGSLGTILSIDPLLKTMRVQLDGDFRILVPTESYPHLRLGYAVTTHKGQGVTVDHSYILAGGPMADRELAYVQLSRARHSTRIFIDQAEAGEHLGDFARSITKSRLQELAHDVQRQSEPHTLEVVR